MKTCKSCLVLTSSLVLLSCALRCAVAIKTEDEAMKYLSKFGYLNPSMENQSSLNIMSGGKITQALKEFQSFFSVHQTGQLDNETLHYMNMPRCGVQDKVKFVKSSKSRRYAHLDFRWKVKDFTYKISSYSKRLSKSKTDSEIQKAFDVWSDVTPLTFTQKKSGNVDIDIRFEVGKHEGDADAFDGLHGILAHAFKTFAHFDMSELWTIDSFEGTNLFQVATHEFGHSLGLSHSKVNSSVMWPNYKGYTPSFKLDNDDIKGIQALYGARSSAKRPMGSDAELCTNTKIDTLFNSADGKTFVFKGNYYWKLMDGGLSHGYPKSIADTWSGLPGDIDTAFTYTNNKTYFFKGEKYWRYTDNTLDDGYPKDISRHFPGIPNNIDAALSQSGKNWIYFFKGTMYWKYDMGKKLVINSYPKHISNWGGIPDNIDAALHYTNGKTYFFKDDYYYCYNIKKFKVLSAVPPYPYNTGDSWFGCGDT